eukprot:5263151-Pleurochrysis_carterae.AAC.1
MSRWLPWLGLRRAVVEALAQALASMSTPSLLRRGLVVSVLRAATWMPRLRQSHLLLHRKFGNSGKRGSPR